MKSFVVFALLVAAAVAAPAGPEADAQIVSQYLNNIGVDGYNSGYETSNGIKAEEQGVLKDAGTDHAYQDVTGQFSYLGTDGVVYTVAYTAGINGFEPRGAHIPQ